MTQSEPTWLFCGHWEGSRIVIDYVLPGDQQDEREDTGRYEQGLWADSASGRTQNIARARAIAQYEGGPDHDHDGPDHDHDDPDCDDDDDSDDDDVNDHLAEAHGHDVRYTESEAQAVHADFHDATPVPCEPSELGRHLRDEHGWDHPFEPDEAHKIHDLLHEGDES